MNKQWHFYKDLELIPASVPLPPVPPTPFLRWLNQLRRSRLDALTRDFLPEEEFEHLERCLAMDVIPNANQQSTWQRLWQFANQPLQFGPRRSRSPEPEIFQTSDHSGQVWWHVHDPVTGNTAFLESEDEVQIWLEQRLYY